MIQDVWNPPQGFCVSVCFFVTPQSIAYPGVYTSLGIYLHCIKAFAHMGFKHPQNEPDLKIEMVRHSICSRLAAFTNSNTTNCWSCQVGGKPQLKLSAWKAGDSKQPGLRSYSQQASTGLLPQAQKFQGLHLIEGEVYLSLPQDLRYNDC